MEIAKVVNSKEACCCDMAGCVISKGERILATGNTVNCVQNAICQAAKFGVALKGATLYTQFAPCGLCAEMIISAGIKRVIYLQDDRFELTTQESFAIAGIELDMLTKENDNFEDDEFPANDTPPPEINENLKASVPEYPIYQDIFVEDE